MKESNKNTFGNARCALGSKDNVPTIEQKAMAFDRLGLTIGYHIRDLEENIRHAEAVIDFSEDEAQVRACKKELTSMRGTLKELEYLLDLARAYPYLAEETDPKESETKRQLRLCIAAARFLGTRKEDVDASDEMIFDWSRAAFCPCELPWGLLQLIKESCSSLL